MIFLSCLASGRFCVRPYAEVEVKRVLAALLSGPAGKGKHGDPGGLGRAVQASAFLCLIQAKSGTGGNTLRNYLLDLASPRSEGYSLVRNRYTA